jgi:hypothetical protein
LGASAIALLVRPFEFRSGQADAAEGLPRLAVTHHFGSAQLGELVSITSLAVFTSGSIPAAGMFTG